MMERNAQIIADRVSGMKYREIAEKHGVHQVVARRVCTRAYKAGEITLDQLGAKPSFGKKKGPKFSDPEAYAHALAKMIKRVKVDANGCWLWQGFIAPNGYGMTGFRTTGARAHRLMYTIVKGPPPTGHDICHTCDVRHCINPQHLWAGTRKQNVEDMTAKRRHYNTLKTHCARGHEYTPENTWHYQGTRRCRQCEAMKGKTRVRPVGRARDKRRASANT